ncbi:hypothetical protein EL17_23120 [Anditalea andensis]|uniref:DUF4402 domain-containing protein n=2 Tax=Anditalea andensis TaxID=1048983 RepID=A0A074L7S3_9BACT|nr:hypothetical protein EL17_23120 [Anditalea andensis]
MVLFGLKAPAQAQVQVYVEHQANFGSFVVGYGGGSILITEEEERIAEGEVFLMNPGAEVQPVVFGIEATLGALVHLQLGPDVQIKGNNGGEATVRMLYPSFGTSFVSTAAPPARNYISIPTLLIMNGAMKSIPGNYAGSLSITVIEE